MNRRGFFGRIGTLIAGLFAAKVAAPAFKSKMWFTSGTATAENTTTWYGDLSNEIVTADGDPICDEYGKHWYSDAK